MPYVSIVIPTYNHAQYLGDAIQSVLNQSYSDYEIIVVNDGSTDNTEEIVKMFADQVRYIRQGNQGLSAARNMGIQMSRGEIIGLLDADDLYEPNFLSDLTRILKSTAQIDSVYCVCQTIDINNNLLPQKIGRVVPSDALHHELLKSGLFPPVCMLAHKYCYEELGMFDKSFQGCADLDMWLRISENYTVIGTKKILARYRVLPQSMSGDPIYMLNDRLAVLKKHFEDKPCNEPTWRVIERKAYGKSYLTAAIGYLQIRDIERAYTFVNKAFTTFPELAKDFDAFYDLCCGDQPKGFRGDFLTIDIVHNAQIVLSILDRLFQDPNVSNDLKCLRRLAYLNAYLALGLLGYGAGQYRESRHFLLKAVVTNPKCLTKSQVGTSIIKTLLGVRLMASLRNKKEKLEKSHALV